MKTSEPSSTPSKTQLRSAEEILEECLNMRGIRAWWRLEGILKAMDIYASQFKRQSIFNRCPECSNVECTCKDDDLKKGDQTEQRFTIDVHKIDVQKLRQTVTDAEFRKYLYDMLTKV